MRKSKTKEDQALDQALDVLIARTGHSPEAIMGADGLLAQLTKSLVERVLGAELTHHLRTGRGPADPMPPPDTGSGTQADDGTDPTVRPGPSNCRNGFSRKTVIGDQGELEIRVPRGPPGPLRAPAGAQMAKTPARL